MRKEPTVEPLTKRRLESTRRRGRRGPRTHPRVFEEPEALPVLGQRVGLLRLWNLLSQLLELRWRAAALFQTMSGRNRIFGSLICARLRPRGLSSSRRSSSWEPATFDRSSSSWLRKLGDRPRLLPGIRQEAEEPIQLATGRRSRAATVDNGSGRMRNLTSRRRAASSMEPQIPVWRRRAQVA